MLSSTHPPPSLIPTLLPLCSYALHLITTAALIAHRRKAAAVDVEDISKAYTLFLDVKRSVQVRMGTRAVQGPAPRILSPRGASIKGTRSG